MRWHGLLHKMIQDVRNTFGQPVIYTRKDNQQSFRITAIYTIKHSESDAGGRIPTTVPRKELMFVSMISAAYPQSLKIAL